jgi:AcrR family transcriptional regulator
LREVTREAGVSPTAFYRHFDDMEELSQVLAEDALGTLRVVMRQVRAETSGPRLQLASSVQTVVAYTEDHPEHLRFLARERFGGIKRLRRVIRREIQLFIDELAVDLGEYRELDAWSIDDRRVLASLMVESLVHMAMELLDARADEKDAIVTQTVRQMRLAILGVPNWRPIRTV